MSKSRLSALLRKNLGLESDRPTDVIDPTATPAVVEETTPTPDVTPEPAVPAAPAGETPAETPSPAETPAVAEERLVVFQASNEDGSAEVPATEVPVSVEPAAAPTEEIPADDAETRVSDDTVSQEGPVGGVVGAVVGAIYGPAGALAGLVIGSTIGDLIAMGVTKLLGDEVKLSNNVRKLRGELSGLNHDLSEYKLSLKEAKEDGDARQVAEFNDEIAGCMKEIREAEKALQDNEKALNKIREAVRKAKADKKAKKASTESIVSTEGEGEEVITQTPAEDAAQAEAEQAVDAAQAPTPPTAEVLPEEVAPVAAVSAEDEAGEVTPDPAIPAEPAAAAPQTPVEQAAEQVEKVEQAAAEVVAADATVPPAATPDTLAEAPAEAVAATEDAGAEVPADPAAVEAPAEVPTADTTAPDGDANTFVGVIEADHEVDEQSQAMESLSEIAEGLTTIAVSLESAIQEGGLQPQAAAMMNLAVQAHTARLGITQPVTASLENFGGMSARTQATKISLEGVEETVKQVWETIKKVAATLWKAMVDFAKKIFAASTWVKEQAEKLNERYESAKGEAKSKELTLKAGLANRLAVDGKIAGKISQALQDIVTVAFDAVEYDKAGLKVIEIERQSMLDAMQSGDIDRAAKIFADNDPVLPKTFNKADGDVHSTRSVAGGVSFTMTKRIKQILSIPVACYYAGKTKSEHALAEDVQFRTPDLQEIGEILNVCRMVVKVGEAVEGMGRSLEEEVEKISFLHVDFSSFKKELQSNLLSVAYHDRATQLNRVSSMVMGHLVTTARASLQVVEQALNEYELPSAA